MARLPHTGFGQVELNQVAFRRDGRVEAQLPLDSSEFSAAAPAENGMILCVDSVNKKITKSAGIPALVYSSEHIYDERTPGLKNFANIPGEIYPRLGYLSIGDKFTTNVYDGTNGAGAVGKYAAPTNGVLTEASQKPATGLACQVIAYTTMPDGQVAVKLQVVQL